MEKKIESKHMRKLLYWTLSYYKPFLFLTISYIFFGGLIILGEILIPRRIGYFIDKILPLNSLTLFYNEIFIFIGITVLILVSKAGYSVLEVHIATGITKNQQVELLRKLQYLGFSYFEKESNGKIISLFENSIREIQQTYTFLFPQFIYCLAQFIVPSIILITEEPIFFICAMVGNVIYIFLNKSTNKKIQYYLGIETSAAHVFNQAAYDSIAGSQELNLMGSKDWVVKNLVDDYDNFRNPRMHSIFWRHFRFTTVGLTLTISIILFYLYGISQIKLGELLLGQFIGYSFLMGIISRGFSVFFYIIPAQMHALKYADDIFYFLNLDSEIKQPSKVANFSRNDLDIRFENVSFGYDLNHEILKDITFFIPYGKRIAIVGESGCGKTTILKLLDRFYDAQSGNITIGNVNIKDIDLATLRNEIGFVFQETYLFDLSIADNIKFAKPEAAMEEVIRAATSAGAHEFIMNTENGYDTVIGERGLRLSGGERQRISIARMFLKNPSILILDEPTSALDSVVESKLKKSFSELAVGKTMIVVAHRLSTIKDFDQIIVLDNGKVVEVGNYDELINQKSYFFNLVVRGAENER